jgi:uncharacterized repeat protein (TIGR03803 family)
MRRFLSSLPLLVLCAVVLASLVPAAHAQTMTVSPLHAFCSQPQCADGESVFAGLVEGPDGMFYGATVGGDGAEPYPQNSGTLFKVNPTTGALTTLVAFCSGSQSSLYCPEGAQPRGSMILGKDGNFYGTTSQGGAESGRCTQGYCGTIFQMTPSGTETVLYSFCSVVVNNSSVCQDGEFPTGALVQGTDGNFYGTTQYGGNAAQNNLGGGTVFQLTPMGVLTTLYNFCKGQTFSENCTDGNFPSGGLVQGSDGNFYGTTTFGGTNNSGTVFQLKMTGASTGTITTIYNFNGGGESGPLSTLVEGSDGSFYGTTSQGSHNAGMVFKVNTAGAFTDLYDFCSNEQSSNDRCLDGSSPAGELVLAGDGNFYGTTEFGGTTQDYSEGTIYKLTPAGVFSSLYSFCTLVTSGFCIDGEDPYAGLTAGGDGNFYGTTEIGGLQQEGNIFVAFYPTPLPAPVQLTLSDSSVAPNTPVELTWVATNAFSKTLQQCYAYVQGAASGAGLWSGLQMGGVTGGVFTGHQEITPTAVGTYTYALTCGGVETGFATLTVTNSGTKSNTTTTLTATPNPVKQGQPLTVTVTVTKDSGSGTPTGTVTIYADETFNEGTLTLVNGSATVTIPTSTVPAMTYSLIAKYSGDGGDNPSNSGYVSETVDPPLVPTTTTVTKTPDFPHVGGTVTLTATVAETGASGVPTGDVTFFGAYKAGKAAELAKVKLNGSGKAVLALDTKGYPAGHYSVYATYAGDSNNAGSTSKTIDFYLTYETDTTITVTPNPVTPPAVVTATIKVSRGQYSGYPGGSVQIYLGSTLLDSATLGPEATLTASYPTTGIPAGTYTVTVNYLGDDNDYGSSVSATVTVK